LGVVFQEPRLLPWRTVEANVRLAARQASEESLGVLFATLGLTEHRRHYPSELSVGLARRVALACAFATNPSSLYSTNPSSLSTPALAVRLRAELVELVSRRPVTTLLVTHDVEEAAALADRLILLSPSPARVLAELTIESPRRARTADELVAIRNEIAHTLTARG